MIDFMDVRSDIEGYRCMSQELRKRFEIKDVADVVRNIVEDVLTSQKGQIRMVWSLGERMRETGYHHVKI